MNITVPQNRSQSLPQSENQHLETKVLKLSLSLCFQDILYYIFSCYSTGNFWLSVCVCSDTPWQCLAISRMCSAHVLGKTPVRKINRITGSRGEHTGLWKIFLLVFQFVFEVKVVNKCFQD